MDARTLSVAVDRLLPNASVADYLAGHFAAYPEDASVVEAGLLLLQARDFAHLAPEAQDAVLAELEAHPSIALLIRLVVEGFYTSPAGYAEVGFRVTA